LPQSKLSSGPEALFRSAVSRAYYSVFCQARNHLLKEGVKLDASQDIHQAVVQVYMTSSAPQRRNVGAKLGRLRRNRNKADYEDVIDNVPFLHQESMQWAAFIQLELSRI
jgi:uncharacterized protein (UPF0332 family)